MDYQQIYASHALEYDALVNAEDCDHNLLPALLSIAPLSPSSTVLEVGVGTGRVTRLLLPRVGRLVGVDRAPAMLEVARRHLSAMSVAATWELHCADGRELPVPSAFADLGIAGWVFGHLRFWLPEDWKENIGKALAEMERALKPGGTMIIIETLGSGSEHPAPPADELAEYYAWLEGEQGMRRESIRTDYLFPDVDAAANVTGFFFGEPFGERVRREQWTRIPECTGIWWKRIG